MFSARSGPSFFHPGGRTGRSVFVKKVMFLHPRLKLKLKKFLLQIECFFFTGFFGFYLSKKKF